MKKVFKVLGAICLSVLIWAAIMAVFIVVYSHVAQKNLDRLAERMGINTEQTNTMNEDDAEVSINVNITQDSSLSGANTSEVYYDTMQDALWYSTISLELEEQYRRNIDEVIKKFEGDEYETIFYRSVKDKREEALNYVRFKIQYVEGEKKYCANRMTGATMRYNSIYMKTTSEEMIRGFILASDLLGVGVNPDKDRFICGELAEKKHFDEGESIYNLTIEGQKPDEIIEYEVFGETWYFWYYNDLQSDKSYEELDINLKE